MAMQKSASSLSESMIDLPVRFGFKASPATPFSVMVFCQRMSELRDTDGISALYSTGISNMHWL